MFRSLREVRGVGDKVSERLLKYYGSEKTALMALENQDFQELGRILPIQKVVEIAREVRAKKYSFKYLELLKTPEAKEIYSTVISAIREHACTEYARLKIALFYPTKDREELDRRIKEVMMGVDLYNQLKGEKLKELGGILRGLRPLSCSRNRVTGKAVVTEDERLYKKLKPYCDVIDIFLIKPGEDMGFLRNYEMVRVVSSGGFDQSFSRGLSRGAVFCSSEVEHFLPEAVLSFFLDNMEAIKSCVRGLSILGEKQVQELEGISEKIMTLNEERERFSRACGDLPTVVEGCLEEANRRVLRLVEELGVSMSGKEVLEVLSGLEAGHGYAALPSEVRDVISEVAREGEEECARMLGLSTERAIFTGLFSWENLYPLEVSREVLAEIEAYVVEEGARRVFRKEQAAAAYLKGREEVVKKAIGRLFHIDYLLALGEFTVTFGASPACLSDSLDFSFREGKHLLLRKKELKAGVTVQPVSYHLGVASPGKARVTVLTGANSGGKTTLLEIIAQIQIMAQSGLPVLAADATVPLVDEIYFYGRRKGSSSAGAFELLLRSMAGIPRTRSSKLILADEIEAVTEPGAAAKILSALLELFSSMRTCLAVVVTHLGEELEVNGLVRIDGIEARGLDENLNLMVDRNPVLNNLARSTPELILERLSRTDDKHREFYRAVLKKFK
jgi:hypothetical protein